MNTMIPTIKFDEVVDGLFNRSISDIIGTDFTHSTPAINVIERQDSFLINLAAPGLSKDIFEVHIEKNVLTISAKEERSTESDTEGADKLTYKRREFNFSSFKRQLRLPENADPLNVQAAYTNGVLEITMAKLKKDEDLGAKRIIIE